MKSIINNIKAIRKAAYDNDKMREKRRELFP